MADSLPPPPRDGDRNRGAAIIATETVFVAIAVVLVLVRLYVRLIIIRGFGYDDFFICLALVSNIYQYSVINAQ